MRLNRYQEGEYHADFQPTLRRFRTKEDRLLRYIHRHYPTAKNLQLSLASAFAKAAERVPMVSCRRGVFGGTPCIAGTRIPIYMVLDAIEYHGNLEGARREYPDLTLGQVKDAIRFSKTVMECPVDDEASAVS